MKPAPANVMNVFQYIDVKQVRMFLLRVFESKQSDADELIQRQYIETNIPICAAHELNPNRY